MVVAEGRRRECTALFADADLGSALVYLMGIWTWGSGSRSVGLQERQWLLPLCSGHFLHFLTVCEAPSTTTTSITSLLLLLCMQLGAFPSSQPQPLASYLLCGVACKLFKAAKYISLSYVRNIRSPSALITFSHLHSSDPSSLPPIYSFHFFRYYPRTCACHTLQLLRFVLARFGGVQSSQADHCQRLLVHLKWLIFTVLLLAL